MPNVLCCACRCTLSSNSQGSFNGGKALVGTYNTLQAVPTTGEHVGPQLVTHHWLQGCTPEPFALVIRLFAPVKLLENGDPPLSTQGHCSIITGCGTFALQTGTMARCGSSSSTTSWPTPSYTKSSATRPRMRRGCPPSTVSRYPARVALHGSLLCPSPPASRLPAGSQQAAFIYVTLLHEKGKRHSCFVLPKQKGHAVL